VCYVKSDDSDKVSLVERVFQTRLVSSARCIVSLQRFDPEWEDLVDLVDMLHIRSITLFNQQSKFDSNISKVDTLFKATNGLNFGIIDPLI